MHTLFDAIAHSDLSWLKRSFSESDFDFNCFNPSNDHLLGCTALQASIASFLGTDSHSEQA